MNKKEAKKQIDRLVNKFAGLTSAEFKKKNESMTCKDYILPLFQALGWDVYNNISNNEVTSETQVSGGRADYAFHVNDVIKFFIEAKKPSVNLREAKHGEQAISYAWHKSVPWAVLTDFKSIKVYSAEWDEPDAERSLIFEINYKDYLKDEKLWWLSKESMEKGDLDKYAEDNFKKPKKEAVDKLLADDLVKWRTQLFNDLKGWNGDKNLTDKQIAESVQRLLDRLIFIRTTEDRKIEGEKLREIARNWEDDKGKINLADEMKKLFKEFNKDYNSKLFLPAICDTLVYEDELLARIIKELYKNAKGIRYDFASINADILGSIYEQYLGQIQQEEKDKKSGKRKSQGIYYTPRYIVDCIVKNTLGELLKGKSGFEASKIKILDPACGSGSFLIKAFEVLDNHIKRENNELDADIMKNYARKVSILTSNIYGVDLDQEAVEIAQLNLLLKVLAKRELLPNLGHNIECGNSLISGKEEKLKKYFGENWKDKKPFNWQEKFEPVFKQGGFDVIIGNPPYVGWAKGKQSREEKDYYEGAYKEIYSGKNDLFYYFIYVSLKMLKENGRFSFIVSRYFLESIWANKLRNYISQNYYIDSIIDFRDNLIFDDAGVHACILTIVKKKEFNKNILVKLNNLNSEPFYIDQKKLNGEIWMLNNNLDSSIIKKIEKKPESILNYFDIKDTKLSALDSVYILKVGQAKELGIEKEYLRKFISSKDINRFFCSDSNKFIIDISRDTKVAKNTNLYKYLKLKEPLINERNVKRKENLGWGLARPMDKYNWDKNKIFCPSRCVENRFIIDKNNSTGSRHNITVLFPKTNSNLYYFLALLNSKLFDFYYKKISKKMGNSYEYLPQYLEKLKILSIEKNSFDLLSRLAEKICEEKMELQKLDPIMDDKEYNGVKDEIAKTDKKIDEEIYKLYGLTEEEIKIVNGENK